MRTLEVDVVFVNESDVDVLRSLVLDSYGSLRGSVPEGRVSMSAALGERTAKYKRIVDADTTDAEADVFVAYVLAAIVKAAPSVEVTWTKTFKDDNEG